MRSHQLLVSVFLIADLERMEQDGIYGGRRNGSRLRVRYAPALHEGD